MVINTMWPLLVFRKCKHVKWKLKKKIFLTVQITVWQEIHPEVTEVFLGVGSARETDSLMSLFHHSGLSKLAPLLRGHPRAHLHGPSRLPPPSTLHAPVITGGYLGFPSVSGFTTCVSH